jgi:hypothetical protein
MMMVLSGCAPQELSNHWSCQYVSTILNFLGNQSLKSYIQAMNFAGILTTNKFQSFYMTLLHQCTMPAIASMHYACYDNTAVMQISRRDQLEVVKDIFHVSFLAKIIIAEIYLYPFKCAKGIEKYYILSP